VQGLIFGDYQFQLKTTDVNGLQANASQDIGAVSMDSNGVVINADPNVDFLFGPMIGLGKNPWGYQDYWALRASQLRLADYLSDGWVQGPLNQPQWEYTGQGTVSFYFDCVGPLYLCNTSLGTTLAANYAPGNTTIAVTNAAGLDLTSLPTHIILFNAAGSNEIRICSASGNVLTLCYDGADQAPLSFSTGQSVLQSKVTGTGTKFLTDPVTAVCPLGTPGPPGPSAYSAGSVSLTANSATMTGTGTVWTSDLLKPVPPYVRISSTHNGASYCCERSNQLNVKPPVPSRRRYGERPGLQHHAGKPDHRLTISARHGSDRPGGAHVRDFRMRIGNGNVHKPPGFQELFLCWA
jgi:hypothetical protein